RWVSSGAASSGPVLPCWVKLLSMWPRPLLNGEPPVVGEPMLFSWPRLALEARGNLGQLNILGSPTTGGSPFSNGLGQIVSGWTQQGIHGQELADRIHWLQSMRADEIAQRTRWMDQRRFDRNDGFRDIREDRREIREAERRLA